MIRILIMSNLYQERDVEELGTYCDHILAITSTYSKRSIAGELAVKDAQIEYLLDILANKVSHRCSINARERLPQFLYVDDGGV
jgi:hypothetical protein